MPRKPAVTDYDLRQFLDAEMPQKTIAALCGVSEAAISQRIKALERKEAARTDPETLRGARTSVWDVRAKLEWAQDQAERLLEDSFAPLERIAALNCLVGQMRFAMSTLSTLYGVEEQAAFQEEVLAVLEEFEPGTREKVIERLSAKRPIRAAAFRSRGALPGQAAESGPAPS